MSIGKSTCVGQAVQEAAVARMRALLETENDGNRFSGVVLVANKGQIYLNEGFGLADVEKNKPLEANNKFMIASVSKAFTAACILKLEQEGKLSVDDPIIKYLPDYPNWSGKEVTIHQLLTHTSGIPDYINDFPISFRLKRALNWHPSRERLLSAFKNKELNFEPGTAYDYSNSGYVLLAQIVENVSGMEFNTYLRKNIFEPLRMTDTGTEDFNMVKNGAVAYGGKTYDPRPLKNFKQEYIFGMGGISSTAKDLYKWEASFADTLILNQAEKKKMFTPYKHGYAYGWEVSEDQGKLIYSHGGYFPGWNSWVQFYPDDSLYIVVLSNQDRSMPFWLAKELADVWFKNQDGEAPVELAAERGEAIPICGRYMKSTLTEGENANGPIPLTEIMVVTQDCDGLKLKTSSGSCWNLEKAGSDSWKEVMGLFRIDFEDFNGNYFLSLTDGSNTWYWSRIGQ